ncbi:hypothetical protein C7S16_3302 [Burkholderia thailandensis]|uniref:Uncharacterized protein n=1 Tax=Burkholderia thailandensis TaxID=57975 RepID=A0AAW9D2K7_BURTH|nr:hypothetical protein [Burkholderia thailandensis]MDW9254501.1 hypothetical protein [Burkholderia thailandensis]
MTIARSARLPCAKPTRRPAGWLRACVAVRAGFVPPRLARGAPPHRAAVCRAPADRERMLRMSPCVVARRMATSRAPSPHRRIA